MPNIASICIPRVESSISKDFIYQKISEMKAGNIRHITEIPLRNDPTQKRIIIKIAWDNNNSHSNKIQQILSEFGSIKLVYNMPWYWKIVATHPQI